MKIFVNVCCANAAPPPTIFSYSPCDETKIPCHQWNTERDANEGVYCIHLCHESAIKCNEYSDIAPRQSQGPGEEVLVKQVQGLVLPARDDQACHRLQLAQLVQ